MVALQPCGKQVSGSSRCNGSEGLQMDSRRRSNCVLRRTAANGSSLLTTSLRVPAIVDVEPWFTKQAARRDWCASAPPGSMHLRSSVLTHFIGPVSAMSFGPLFRFVIGSEYSVQSVQFIMPRASQAA
jgi:hypothetical protein